MSATWSHAVLLACSIVSIIGWYIALASSRRVLSGWERTIQEWKECSRKTHAAWEQQINDDHAAETKRIKDAYAADMDRILGGSAKLRAFVERAGSSSVSFHDALMFVGAKLDSADPDDRRQAEFMAAIVVRSYATSAASDRLSLPTLSTPLVKTKAN